MLTVGVRRYTDATNRGFAFGLFYSVMNIAAFISGTYNAVRALYLPLSVLSSIVLSCLVFLLLHFLTLSLSPSLSLSHTHTHTLSLSLSHTHTHTHTHNLSPPHSLSLSHTYTLSLPLSLSPTGFIVDFFNISIGVNGLTVLGYNWSGNRLVILSGL